MAGDRPSSPRPHSSAELIDLEIGVFGAFPDLSQPRDAPALLRQVCPIHAGNAGRPWSTFVGRPETERNARKPHFNANRKGKTAPAYRVYQIYAMTRRRNRDQGPSPSPDPGISRRTPGNVRRTRHGRFSHGANGSFGSEGERASTLRLDGPAHRSPAPEQGLEDLPEAGGAKDGKPPTPGTAAGPVPAAMSSGHLTDPAGPRSHASAAGSGCAWIARRAVNTLPIHYKKTTPRKKWLEAMIGYYYPQKSRLSALGRTEAESIGTSP
ncbi:hypothetical protein SAMN05216276_1001132 [Streptosporangium subroseum]|uniref:Uncharacterized protein n=1 Tax=Streptosporangium subroseum TaxID=106412 RepID=A0A239A5H3_9ACTN|nr:hypothetical protein SAMN05216276_1001132 [Streptosporangium subroseum]